VSATALLLVLAAAGLHATWNALAKRAGDSVAFLWVTTCCAAVLTLPPAAAELGRAGLTPAAAPFVLATIALHGLYFYALGRAYATGAFSLVYPVARGLGVALVAPAALLTLGERLSPLGVAGVALVAVGIATLHLAPGAAAPAPTLRAGLGAATGWAVLTGLAITGYSLVDKAGVARMHPVPYFMLMEAGTAAVLLPAALRRREAVRREWRTRWPRVLLAAACTAGAYTMVLFAFRLSKAGYVVAARELSIVLSAFVGSLWFGEGPLVPRLGGAALVVAGVACVALAA
jgi:drug/metabolite transporter (DMT)-like permease